MVETAQERTRWLLGVTFVLLTAVGTATWAIASRDRSLEENMTKRLEVVTALVEENAAAIRVSRANLELVNSSLNSHKTEPYHRDVIYLINKELEKAIGPIQRSLDRIEGKLEKRP